MAEYFAIGFAVGGIVMCLVWMAAEGIIKKFFEGWVEKRNCHHDWELLESTRYSDAPDSFLYVCKKCGKMKKKSV